MALSAASCSKGNSSNNLSGAKEKHSAGVEELSNEDLLPISEPGELIRNVIQRLSNANNAKRKELNWQEQYDALNDARRLVAHHVQVVIPNIHEFVLSILPAVDQLRSSTVKNALILLQEMFSRLSKHLDKELDEIVPVLLKKAADISNAGEQSTISMSTSSVNMLHIKERKLHHSLQRMR